MQRRSILLFCLCFSFYSINAKAESRAEWKTTLSGRSTDDTLSSSKTVGITGLVRLQHEFSDSLESLFIGGARMETGSSSSLFTDEFEPKSRLVLQEASLKWRVFSPFSLKAGAISQNFSPLLLSSSSFPAAQATLEWNPNQWKLQASSQAAIPTSQTFSSRAVGKENTPTLFTHSVLAGWQGDSSIFFKASYFQFRNLTHGMAKDSRFYGNSINGIANASTFAYQYEGILLGVNASSSIYKNLNAKIGINYLQNSKGPKNNDSGYYGYLGFGWDDESFSLSPTVEIYRNEADSSPAFFTSQEFGHNNRKGMGAKLRLELKKEKLQIEFRARKGDLLEARTFQRNRFEYYELLFEIPYTKF